jgi:hypothetical protein
MKTIALISCVSQKLDHKAKVKDIYISPLFKKNMEYARLRNVDDIYILSAEHGLLELDWEIEPYNKTLNDMKGKEKLKWAKKVYADLLYNEDIDDTNFIFLAGKNYRQHLEMILPHTEIPMEGLPIGKQLQFLTREINRMKTESAK